MCNDYRVINTYLQRLDTQTASLNAINPAAGHDKLCLRLKYQRSECYPYQKNGKGLAVQFPDDPHSQTSELFDNVDPTSACNETVSVNR